jgi:hypothetical protein
MWTSFSKMIVNPAHLQTAYSSLLGGHVDQLLKMIVNPAHLQTAAAPSLEVMWTSFSKIL